ncbi:Microfibrillar-associated protein 1 [Intoshia linei]|uniref:Microfibrillar-associated protein 1 n=1 Tax=Intoshia linei TaxID=1819745 RepID=A0A177B5V5_9BILA|nr:Microfibrillar-associated protein 1 [Intoshia linei]
MDSKKDKPIQSTAGAISYRNVKGEVAMKKVKVNRYVAGKRPEYAYGSDESSHYSDQENEDDKKVIKNDSENTTIIQTASFTFTEDVQAARVDRLNRILEEESNDKDFADDPMERIIQHRRNVVCEDDEDMNTGPFVNKNKYIESSDEEEDTDRSITEKRKKKLNIVKEKHVEEELLPIEDEESDEKSEESDLYEEESEYEYEDEIAAPRLKPVFVVKSDRITTLEKEEIEKKEALILEHKKRADRLIKKQTVDQINSDVNNFATEQKANDKNRLLRENEIEALEVLNTDDEDDNMELYEEWKLRELKRIKRHRDELESHQREQADIDKLRSMSETERVMALKQNPRIVTNKAIKGTYKFLQRYFHRGAFYMDSEESVYKRNFAEPTLEDKFDKTVLPAVMQVKNFGRASRTKYTHLVDQDTTDFESAWAAASAQNIKFHSGSGGGTKDSFTRPSQQKRRNR